MKESNRAIYGKNVDKWVALTMMQQAEQIYRIAELLDATMQDLSDQVESLSENIDQLTEVSDTILDRIDELSSMLEDDPDIREASLPDDNYLPF